MGSLIFRFMFLKKKLGCQAPFLLWSCSEYGLKWAHSLCLEKWDCFWSSGLVISRFILCLVSQKNAREKGVKFWIRWFSWSMAHQLSQVVRVPWRILLISLYFPHFLWNQTCCLWWWSWFLILFFLKGIIYLVFTVSISPISFPTESLFFFFFFFVENLFSIKDQLSLDLGYYFRVELVLFVWLFGFRGNLTAVLGFSV